VVALVTMTGGSEVGPATGAAEVVPADALAYVNLSTDPSRSAVRRARSMASRFPDYPRLLGDVESRMASIMSGGTPVDFPRDIRPWLGNEAALAVLNTTTATAGSLVILDVSDRHTARAFLIRSGAASAGTYRGTQLLAYPTGTELAFVGHYLIFGQDASVRAGIDVHDGAAPSLASDDTYQQAASGEPADRVLDAYASAAGLRRMLLSRGGAIGAAASLVDQPALAGATLSVSATSPGLRLRVHSVLDPQLAQIDHVHRVLMTPSLQSLIPAGSALLLDTSALTKVGAQFLRAAALAGVAGQLQPLLSHLGTALKAEGVNLPTLLSLFGGETALAISPAADPTRPPALTIVTRTHNPTRAREELANLQVPLSQLFPAPGGAQGATPLFNQQSVAGITAHQLTLTPGLQLDYAIFDGLLVVSTSLDGIAGVAERTHALGNEAAFRDVLGTHESRIGSLVFLDFSQLLGLGEQMGLMRSARLRALGPDLQKISAVGASSTGGETDTTAELLLHIQ
jgi:hypothetical protein